MLIIANPINGGVVLGATSSSPGANTGEGNDALLDAELDTEKISSQMPENACWGHSKGSAS